MDAATEQRFAELDSLIARVQVGNQRFAEATADAIAEMEDKLTHINEQNVQLAERVQVLGGYVNVSIEALQRHASDGHGALDDE